MQSAGMVFCFALPFFYKLSIVMGPALVPVNLDLVNAMFDHAGVSGSFLAPSMLEQISKDPASLARIAKTDFTVVGGGESPTSPCDQLDMMLITCSPPQQGLRRQHQRRNVHHQHHGRHRGLLVPCCPGRA